MTSDDLISQLILFEKAHPEAAKVTVGSRTASGKISNHLVIRYKKRHHHVIIEAHEETKRSKRVGRRSARKK